MPGMNFWTISICIHKMQDFQGVVSSIKVVKELIWFQ